MTANIISARGAAGFSALCAQSMMALVQNQMHMGRAVQDLVKKETLKALVQAMAAAGLVAGVGQAFDLPTSAAQAKGLSGHLQVGKEYVVLGISHDTRSEYWITHLLELPDELGGCTYAPLCLFEITDPRPSIFWKAKIIDNDLTLWPPEFYREFFHDDLSEGKPEIKRVFDIVVDRLTYEFDDATQGLPDPLAWSFEEYK